MARLRENPMVKRKIDVSFPSVCGCMKRIYAVDRDEVWRIQTPIIAHFTSAQGSLEETGHYVLVTSYDNDRICTIDYPEKSSRLAIWHETQSTKFEIQNAG